MSQWATRAVALLTLAFASSVTAQSTAIREVLVERLDSGSFDPDSPILVTGKYKELIDGNLVLHGTSVRFQLITPELKKRVLDFVAHRDNLTIIGKLSSAGATRLMEVSEIYAASSDVEQFSAQEKLLKDESQDTPGLALGLVRKILNVYQVHADPALLPLVRRMFSLSLGKEPRRLDLELTAERLAVVRQAHTAVGNMELTVELAAELEAWSSDKSPVEQWLRSLSARHRGGKWVTYSGLKRKEGFVEHEGRWISRREKAHLIAMEHFRKERQALTVLRRRTDKEYKLLAEKGVVESGMKPEEVTASLGFPDRVERKVFEKEEFDQWIYDGEYYYFYAGSLVLKPD